VTRPKRSPDSAASSVRARLFAAAAVLLCVAGCSLISVKSPERPLSSRDLNARILTREFSYHFIAVVEQCADDIAANDSDPEVLANALRWKIGAAAESQRAATRLAPMMALLDTWALASQMQQLLSPGGAGGALFGSHQEVALTAASELDEGAQNLARRLIAPGEFAQYQQFVATYTREHPLRNLQFVRASVVELWSQRSGAGTRLVDSIGTIPEAMEDVSERTRIASEALTLQTIWRTELALRESGFSQSEIRAALRQLDERLAKVSAAAESAPQLVQEAVADVRQSLINVLHRVDASAASILETLRSERAALSADVRTEREAVVMAADAERKAIAQDAARIADQIVKSSGEQARSLAREVLLLLIVLAVVVLGLPFAAGYLVGRARSGRIADGSR
jgi:DNA-binding transcriptional MerR regulator